MRKSYNGLSGVVRQGLGRDPMSGEVFIFMNRRRMIMKLLVWDRSGWVIWSKRLEVGTFELPRRPDGDKGFELRWEELVLILEGVRLGSVRKRKRYEATKKWQGTALGIVGAGNAGAAITTMFAPALLNKFTGDGTSVDQWKLLPQIYAFVLFGMSIVYLLFAKNKRPEGHKTLSQLIKPIKNVRVWRFGLYYFLVFGCFVAFSQWLVPYFVNVYGVSLVTAGFFASLFSFPSGVIRVFGGWLSDKWVARKVKYLVICSSLCISFFLIIPRMELITPGAGIMASAGGEVRSVSDTSIQVGDKVYPIKAKVTGKETFDRSGIFPQKEMWHEVVVKQGQIVEKKQLLAKASTCIFFQANIWVFAILVTIIGAIWGIGKAAVYKHIPEYFPEEVGMVGGLVGVIGGMGGFLFPILFGYLLQYTGFWTSSWILMWILSGVCLIWMHRVITRMMNREAPHLAGHLEPLPKNNE